MWRTLSAFCLFSLVLTCEWVSGERQQFRLKHSEGNAEPKERKFDKMPPCIHDEVLCVAYNINVLVSVVHSVHRSY